LGVEQVIAKWLLRFAREKAMNEPMLPVGICEDYLEALGDLKDTKGLDLAFLDCQRAGGYFARPEISEIRKAYRARAGEAQRFAGKDAAAWRPACEFCGGTFYEYTDGEKRFGEERPAEGPALMAECRDYEKHRLERERLFAQ
jgi:hypothetical protein